MTWLKRNLFLVVGVVVAVGLLGFAVFYLITKIKQNDDITTQLKDATTELNTLVTRKPHPDAPNIAAAKKEQQKLEGFLAEVHQQFPPLVLPEKLDDQKFGFLLDTTVSQLRREAQANGVELPSKTYSFTFESLQKESHFPSLDELTSRLIEVKALSEILFHAKINKLAGLKRAAVAKETGTGNDYLSAKPVTNKWTIATPYEVSFDGFSSELADVLQGLLSSKLCFVVNNVVVEPASSASTDTSSTSFGGTGISSDPAAMYQRRYGMVPPTLNRPDSPASRYGGMGGGDSRMRGMGGRYSPMPPGLAERYRMGPPPTPQPAPRPAGRGGLVNLVEENLLRFTLTLQAVKFRPAEKATEGKPLAKASTPAASPGAQAEPK